MAERPEDLALPLAVISRIINEAIPPNTVVTAEVRKALCKTASVFILYTTATAGAMAAKHGRKTMNGNDVIEAIQEMDFPMFVEPLKKSLQHFRDQQQKKKETLANKKSEEVNKPSSSSDTTTPTTSAGASRSGQTKGKGKSPPGKQGSHSAEIVTISSDSSD